MPVTNATTQVESDRDRSEEAADPPWEHSGEHSMDLNPWDEQTCKYCGSHLDPDMDPGNAWVHHLDERPDCREEHEIWRENQEGDWGGGV